MRPQITFGGIELGVAPKAAGQAAGRTTPLRIAVIGDFSGRANRLAPIAAPERTKLRFHRIDRDNFDDVLRKLDVGLDRLLTTPDGQAVSVRMRELDDFTPDRLLAEVNVFEQLRNTRRRLLKPATFDQAAAEVRAWAVAKPAPAAPTTPSEPEPGEPATGPLVTDLFDSLLDETQQQAAERPTDVPDWQAFVRDIVAPYVVPGRPPEQAELLRCVDEALAGALRRLLHHPQFQALEAAWRGLWFVVRRLETDESLQIHLLDISRAEIAADMAQPDLTKAALYHLLVEQAVGTSGSSPWGVIVGNFTFGMSEDDVVLAERLGQLAAAAGAPLVAAGGDDLVGCSSPRQTPEVDDWADPEAAPANTNWQQLRGAAVAPWLALAWPRFLARVPYGSKTRPIDAFDFEELSAARPHDEHLWGNPAFLVAARLGEAFTESGWQLEPGLVAEFESLPSYTFDDDGEPTLQTCGELLLRERGAARVVERGLIPVISSAREDKVTLGRMTSISGQPLAGRWLS
jgi:type VI secretion system protein ImpC